MKFMSKGQFPEDIGWTLIVLVMAVFIGVAFIMYALVITKVPFIGKDPISTSLEFVTLSSRPHILAESVLFRKIIDRQFLEHAIESSFVGSMESAGSGGIENEVRYFVDRFDIKFYQISIKDTEGNEIFQVSEKLTECQDDKGNAGVCTKKFVNSEGAVCGNGADRIDDVFDACKVNEVCCAGYEYKTNGHNYYQSRVYPDDPNKRETACGPNQNEKFGICDYPRKDIRVGKKRIATCRAGMTRIDEENDECKNRNPGDDLICCLPVSYGTGTPFFETKSVVPLLYKGKDRVGYIEVITGA